ncbi:MAG: methyltransferase domain-containing protein [candidate division Zixibacteria bacterium]|nr:methyltransferase domain-containing protein [candidate division Zixibacteria bacterium]
MKRQTRDYYNGLVRWGKPLDEANQERVQLTVGLVPPGISTVLDLGCGDGTVSNLLVRKGLKVTGVDISPVALKYFKGKGIIANLDQFPFLEHCFDLVICAEVLEHLLEGVYERTLKEIERVARHYVIITTPNEEYLPANFVKCENCGRIYHMNLHTRAFDRIAHRTLFQEFELVKTVEINNWRHCSIISWFEQKFLGVYKFKEGLVCPRCGHNGVDSATLGLTKKFLLKAFRLLDRWLPQRSKPRWIASLYRSGGREAKK